MIVTPPLALRLGIVVGSLSLLCCGADPASPPDDGAQALAEARVVIEAAAQRVVEAASSQLGDHHIQLVAALVTPDASQTLGAAANGPVPGADARFPVLSVTKALTGIIMARQVVAGRLPEEATPSALVRELGEDSALAAALQPFDDAKMDHLISHSGGLADLPGNWRSGFGYTRAELLECLGGGPGFEHCAVDPSLALGTPRYSNVGLGLAAIALYKSRGAAWREQHGLTPARYEDVDALERAQLQQLFDDELFAPLGMSNSRMSELDWTGDARCAADPRCECNLPSWRRQDPDLSCFPDVVSGWGPDPSRAGEVARFEPPRIGILAGGGGLITTAGDKLKLLQMVTRSGRGADIADGEATMERAAREVFVDSAAGEVGTGLGYAIGIDDERADTFFKTGGHTGYSSLLIWSPTLRVGVWATITAGSSLDVDRSTKDNAIGDFAKLAFDALARLDR